MLTIRSVRNYGWPRRSGDSVKHEPETECAPAALRLRV